MAEPAPSEAHGSAPARSLIVVAGSGRSGTSLVSGLLKRLGARVPEPEVPADESNPRGFAESQWVVDFHTRLLRRAQVQVSDARPAAWSRTAPIALDAGNQAKVRAFLAQQFQAADDVLIKDPRLTWFLPLWLDVAAELGAAPHVITMLRHPTAVTASKQKHYGAGAQGDSSRASGWINQTLFTEHATRGVPRTFLRYDRLLDDWRAALGGLELQVVQRAPEAAFGAAGEFLDATLDRSTTEWGAVPASVRDLAEAVWAEISDPAPRAARLDELRAAYTTLYEEAEGIAFSSILAGQENPVGPRRPLSPRAGRLLRRVPAPVRRALPRSLRGRLLRSLWR